MYKKVFVVVAILSAVSWAGIYSGPSNDPANPYDAPISNSDSRIQEWADIIEDFSPSVRGGQSGSYYCLGDLDQSEIDSGVAVGSITLSFPTGIADGSGADFAVYENGFMYGAGLFMELAYVQVSSDGINFAQFDCVSTNTGPIVGSGAFAGYDVTNIYNLAGKHASGWGTPFDLDELASDALVTQGLLDLSNIQYVKLVDIPGSGSFTDSAGNPIYDNWLTSGTGGYDFRLGNNGIGVLNVVPEPATIALLGLGGLLLRRKKD